MANFFFSPRHYFPLFRQRRDVVVAVDVTKYFECILIQNNTF